MAKDYYKIKDDKYNEMLDVGDDSIMITEN